MRRFSLVKTANSCNCSRDCKRGSKAGGPNSTIQGARPIDCAPQAHCKLNADPKRILNRGCLTRARKRRGRKRDRCWRHTRAQVNIVRLRSADEGCGKACGPFDIAATPRQRAQMPPLGRPGRRDKRNACIGCVQPQTGAMHRWHRCHVRAANEGGNALKMSHELLCSRHGAPPRQRVLRCWHDSTLLRKGTPCSLAGSLTAALTGVGRLQTQTAPRLSAGACGYLV
jgi:hypothetical protein